MRQAVSIKVICHVREILVSLLVGILIALCLKNTFTVLETTGKNNLRARLGHSIVG